MKRDLVERTAAVGSTYPNGFTLLEVLAAMVIFSMGILALAGLQITTINGNARARMQTEATAIGVRTLERLLSLPFDHDDLLPTADPHWLPASASRPYTVGWTVTDATPLSGTKRVRVTVTPVNTVNARLVTISAIFLE